MVNGIQELIELLELIEDFYYADTPYAKQLAYEQSLILRAGVNTLVAQLKEEE